MVLDPLAQLNLLTIGAIILIALLTLLVLRRVFFLPLLEVMERRAARIEAARARKAAAEAAMAAAEAEAGVLLDQAKAEAEGIAAKVQVEMAALRAERLGKASAEAEAVLAGGREEVLALGNAEAAALEGELFGCVNRTLARMIGTPDEASIRYLVQRVLTGTEARGSHG